MPHAHRAYIHLHHFNGHFSGLALILPNQRSLGRIYGLDALPGTSCRNTLLCIHYQLLKGIRRHSLFPVHLSYAVLCYQKV